MQYKTHIGGLVEYHYGAIMHATDSVLGKLDRIQSSFVAEMDMTEEVAFLDHNFAPPRLRRDIGILGFLHERVLGLGHPALEEFLPFDPVVNAWHNKQLEGHCDSCVAFHPLYNRSIFGMVHVYNRLHQCLIDLPTVQLFQSALTKMAKAICRNGDPDWRNAFHSDAHVWITRRYMD